MEEFKYISCPYINLVVKKHTKACMNVFQVKGKLACDLFLCSKDIKPRTKYPSINMNSVVWTS